MARTLTFILGGASFATTPAVVDRKKLYGWTETLALDDAGNPCSLATIDETGTFIVPKSGSGLGTLDQAGCWIERSQLKGIHVADGSEAAKVASSFAAPVELGLKVDENEVLDHAITAIYQLDGADGLREAIGTDIYRFSYSYNGGWYGTNAFVLVSGENVFMLLGYRTEWDYVGLDQVGAIVEDAEAEDEDSGEIDFSMM
jgi:hypothetical protein